MSKKVSKEKKQKRTYVIHPRYGSEPIKSEYDFSEGEIKNSFWGYMRVSFFEETAIPANTEKQDYSVFPRPIYVDIEKQCCNCNRWFIFFALEQKHWYEDLGFYIDADCVKCSECRKSEQEIKKMLKTYQKLLETDNRTKKETKELKKAALELFQRGYIKNIEKINTIK